MTRHARVYRSLMVLYPRSFRREYGPDLVQTFVDLAHDRGVVSAWIRCWIDVAVTVPRYRMEALMHRRLSSSAVTGLAFVVGLAGVTGLLLGAVVAVPLLAIAAILAVSQRTALARSLVVPPDHRHPRWRIAGSLAGVCGAAIGSWTYHVNRYDSLGDLTVLVHNLVGVLAFVAAVAFGLAAIFSRTAVHAAVEGK